MSIATVAAAASSSLSAAADVGQMKSFSFSFPSCWAVSFSHHKLTPTPPAHCPRRRKLSRRVICEVAAADVSPSTSSDEATAAAAAASSKIGARVTVKVPLKVYHVPRVPEVDITGMEGELKQYVGLWKGKRISANLPYKVQFVVDVQGRGAVKFFAHLKEDEFEYL
ncbi:hypothetical protein ACFX19_010874 [Malus domestica]